ncbi:DNA helicase [Trifolium repens]|nr:DNA helicase [Trifolium repens]
MVDGASVQVRSWSYGNLSKRDALRFSRAVLWDQHLNIKKAQFLIVQELDKSVDVNGLLEASFDQMDQEIKTHQSQKYSSSKSTSPLSLTLAFFLPTHYRQQNLQHENETLLRNDFQFLIHRIQRFSHALAKV